jgi:hypothetical protein
MVETYLYSGVHHLAGVYLVADVYYLADVVDASSWRRMAGRRQLRCVYLAVAVAAPLASARFSFFFSLLRRL